MSDAKSESLPAYYSNSRPELVQLVQPAGLRILEVGCAGGAMGAALLAGGAREVVGLDVFEPALELARTRLTAAHRIDLNGLEDLPYPDGHFDLMTFADVLEHLVEPAAVLRHLRRWLAGGGKILVSIPNIRHESVVLPLLVEGKWEYADWGILDRTHLRFFTKEGVKKLLADGGFAVAGRMAGVQTPRPDYVVKAAELVEALGGDPAQFLEECDVIQFVFLADPVQARSTARPGTFAGSAPPRPPLPQAQAAAVPAPGSPAPPSRGGAIGPWAGSRRVRVLVVPDLEDPADCLGPTLASLAGSMHAKRDMTLAVVLPTALLERPPPAIASIAGSADIDLLLTELPRTSTGWETLVGGATMVITTSPRPDLEPLVRRMGAEMHDARRDPAMAGPPIATAAANDGRPATRP